jgi:hypothetical protein
MWDEPFDIEALDATTAEGEPVLVVVVPSARDWERVQREAWYRIPVQRAPPRIGARYLAFYHTAACGEALRWRIAHYAPVRGYRVVPRSELLPEEPDHPRAGQLYYRVALGPLEALPRPIPSRSLRRVTFIATTLARLLGAVEINDLWDRETARDRLWRALRAREVPAERGYTLRDGASEYCIDLAVRRDPQRLAIYCLGPDGPGAPKAGLPPAPPEVLERQGWQTVSFPVAAIMEGPARCAEAVCSLLEGAGAPAI